MVGHFVERVAFFGSPEYLLERWLSDSSPYGLMSESLEIRFLFSQAQGETTQHFRSLQTYAAYAWLNPE